VRPAPSTLRSVSYGRVDILDNRRHWLTNHARTNRVPPSRFSSKGGSDHRANPEDVDNVYDAKGIDVVRRGEIDFLIRERPKIEIIGYRMLEPEEGPWRPYDENDSSSKQAALAEVRCW